MAEPVDPKKIEGIVGTKRSEREHYLRIVSAEGQIYILHSHECLRAAQAQPFPPYTLHDCLFTVAMDEGGVRPKDWDRLLDRPVEIRITAKGNIKPRQPIVYREPPKGHNGVG